VQSLADTTVIVTNTSGGTDVGSLRWAAAQLNATKGGTIEFDPTLAGDTIVLDAQLELMQPTTLYGPEEKGITLSGNDQHRVIWVGHYSRLYNVTITGGNADFGAAVHADSGVGIYYTTVQDNRGRSAIFARRAWLDIMESTVSRNTVSTAAVEYDRAHVRILHATIAFNAPGAGLAIYSAFGSYPTSVEFTNSIVSNNGSPVSNCASTYGLRYVGTNISNDWSCGEVDFLVADPRLLPLADNGGPNMTHAIPPTSPAFNKGTRLYDIHWDQRWVRRDEKPDVGAYEFVDSTKVTVTIGPAVKVDAAGRAVLTGTIKCTRYEYFRLALELHQDQKLGKQVVDTHAHNDLPIECAPSGGRWSAPMAPGPGEAFRSGAARAIAYTFQTPEWVVPARVASAVKISTSRK